MNKIKMVLVLFVLGIILSGCTATDTVTLTDEGNVTESVSVMESNSKVLYGNKTLEESVKQALSEYASALNVRKYKTNVKVEAEKSGVIINNEFDDFCKFIDNTIFSQYLYTHINCYSADEYYTVESVGNFITLDSHYVADQVPDVMKLKLKLPFSLTENNADEVNGNTYIWTYDKNTSPDKTIRFKVSKSEVERIKKETEERKRKEETKKKVIKITSVILSILLFIVLIVAIAFRLYKKAEKNKLDY